MVAISGNGWRLAPSLISAAVEATRLAPQRSIRSDGSIGDTAHSSRVSDHNPDPSGDVLAIDLTHDPAGGFDAHAQAENIRQRRDPRVKYVISRGRMFSSYATSKRAAWEWGTYTGVNKHSLHIHISILDTAAAKNDRALWFSAPAPPTPEESDDMTSSAFPLAVGSTLHYFCSAPDGDGPPALWHKIGTGAWYRVGGELAEGTSPAATQNAAGIHVVVIGTDRQPFRITYAAGNWGGFVGLGGQVA